MPEKNDPVELLEQLGAKVEGMRASIDASLTERLADEAKARTEHVEKLAADNAEVRSKLDEIQTAIATRGLKPIPGLEDAMPEDVITRTLKAYRGGKLATEGGVVWEAMKANFEKNGEEISTRLAELGLNQRTLQTLVDGKGGFLLPMEWEQNIVDNTFRASTVLGGAGVTTISPSHTYKIARKTGNTTAYRRTEGVAVAASEISLGTVTMTPKGLGARSRLTLEQMNFGDGRVEQLNRQDLLESLMLRMDLDAFYGDGGDSPLGLVNTPGVIDLDINSGTAAMLKWSQVESLMQSLRDAKVNLGAGNFRFVAQSRVFYGLQTERTGGSTATDGPYVFGPGRNFASAMPYPALFSEQFPMNAGTSDEADIFFGDFRSMFHARYGGVLVLDSFEGTDGTFNALTQGGKHTVAFAWDDVAYVTPPSMVYSTHIDVAV